MDEVFKALGGSASSGPSSLDPSESLPPLTPTSQQSQALLEDNESHNVKNEIKEMTAKFGNKDVAKKKQAMVSCITYYHAGVERQVSLNHGDSGTISEGEAG